MRYKGTLTPMAFTHRRPPWVTNSRHNSKLQPNHAKHKHTNPHPTPRKPATNLTRHHNHNKHTTKKYRLDHKAGTKLRPSANPDHLQNKDKLQNPTTPQNLHKQQQSKLARIHTGNRTNTRRYRNTTKGTHCNKNTNQCYTRHRQTPHTEKENTPLTKTTARTHKKPDKTAQHNKTPKTNF